jgi:ribosomal protein S18 acetylase RimI-like enzyme
MPSFSDDPVADLEAGLCASWARQVALSSGGSLHRLGGLLVALSGVADQTQQVALVERPVVDPASSVIAAEALFRAAGWMPAFDLVDGAHPALEEVLVERGYRIAVERPGMVHALGTRPRRRPVVGTRIASPTVSQLGDLVAVQGRAFGLAGNVASQLLPPTSLGSSGFEVLVAIDAHGEVVGGLCLHLDGPLAGIIGAAVDPERQRQGIGSALTSAALERAEAQGARTVWLQATLAGEPLWRHEGFVDVRTCQVWLVSQEPPPELHPGPRPTGL